MNGNTLFKRHQSFYQTKKRFSSRFPAFSPFVHLEKGFSFEALLISVELDAQLGEELVVRLLLEVHDRLEKLVDGVEDEHAETALSAGAFLGLPFLFLFW